MPSDSNFEGLYAISNFLEGLRPFRVRANPDFMNHERISPGFPIPVPMTGIIEELNDLVGETVIDPPSDCSSPGGCDGGCRDSGGCGGGGGGDGGGPGDPGGGGPGGGGGGGGGGYDGDANGCCDDDSGLISSCGTGAVPVAQGEPFPSLPLNPNLCSAEDPGDGNYCCDLFSIPGSTVTVCGCCENEYDDLPGSYERLCCYVVITKGESNTFFSSGVRSECADILP